MLEGASSNTAHRSAAATLAYLPPHGLRHPPEVAAVGVHDGEVSWPEPVVILSRTLSGVIGRLYTVQPLPGVILPRQGGPPRQSREVDVIPEQDEVSNLKK